MSEPRLIVVSILVLLLGNGLFSGSEIAIITARRSRIEVLIEQGSRAARRVKALQEQMDQFLATVQIGVTAMGTLAGVLGGVLATRYVAPRLSSLALPEWMPPALVASAVVGAAIVYVGLVFGELVPKAVALRHTEPFALVASGPLLLLARLSRWLVKVLTASTRLVLRVFGIRWRGPRSFVSEEEIKHLARKGRQQGVLNQTEMEIIHGVFDLTETPVRKVMVPRPKIFSLDVHTPADQVGRLVVEAGFSRIPVYEDSIDSASGLLYIKDVLRVLERGEPLVVQRLLHPVHFVPETKKVGHLLKELQRRRTHMALVIDEHGSVSGLVTLEDILEEIVGEIHDEHDWEQQPVERLQDGSLVVEGTVSASELRDDYEVPLPESAEFETVAGFMLDRLGSVPTGGEVVGLGGWRFTVVDVERNRISKVKIERRPEEPASA